MPAEALPSCGMAFLVNSGVHEPSLYVLYISVLSNYRLFEYTSTYAHMLSHADGLNSEIAQTQMEEVSKFEAPRTCLTYARKRYLERDRRPTPPQSGKTDAEWIVSLFSIQILQHNPVYLEIFRGS